MDFTVNKVGEDDISTRVPNLTCAGDCKHLLLLVHRNTSIRLGYQIVQIKSIYSDMVPLG